MTQIIIIFGFIALVTMNRSYADSNYHARNLTTETLVIWNVGQGSWATFSNHNLCLHFDIGGEFNPIQKVAELCKNKSNVLAISHLDWDHVSFLNNFLSIFKKYCLYKLPLDQRNNSSKKIITQLPLCNPIEIKYLINQIYLGMDSKLPNDTSMVLLLKNKILFPGDSPKSKEKKWASNVPPTTIGLVLGHHGSYTSTSEILLKKMPQLKWAVASARHSRYGHPHKKTLNLLSKYKVPILKTEDWGNIYFYFPQSNH